MYAHLTSPYYDILMIATGTQRALLQELLASIDENGSALKILVVVVFQGREKDLPQPANFNLKWDNAGEPLSLSRARNRGLKLAAKELERAKHIMYPDDDTIFPRRFFEEFPLRIKQGEAYLCRVLNRENYRDYKSYPPVNKQHQSYELLPFLASVALILPGHLVEQVGKFDERLGAGATWGSSEDVDYYLRCLEYSSFHFVRELYTLHPGRFSKYKGMNKAKIWQRFKSYSDGYYFVMYKHGLQRKLHLLPWRSLAGALVSLLNTRVTLSFLYLRLFCYRLALQQKLKQKQRFNPFFFKPKDES